MRRTMIDRLRVIAGSLALVGLGALLHAACHDTIATSEAAPRQRPEDLQQPLAVIDDTTITVGDFQNLINKQSPYVRARYTSLERKKEFLDNLVRFEVLANEAERRGLDKDDDVVRTMKQAMISKLLKSVDEEKSKLDDVTDADCKAYYDAHPEEFNTAAEVRVAHILVKDQATAKRVAADPRIKGDNEEFRKLVAEYSTDLGTKDRGGDLKYFDANTKEIPQPIVKAAFALENLGDVSPPVRSPAGWHVLKLIGRRKAVVHPFEESKAVIRPKLLRDRRQGALDAFIRDLRAKAKIEVHQERLAKVVIDVSSNGWNGPGVPPPGPGMFHPGANVPQVGPAVPGQPPGAQQITLPPSTQPPTPPPPPANP